MCVGEVLEEVTRAAGIGMVETLGARGPSPHLRESASAKALQPEDLSAWTWQWDRGRISRIGRVLALYQCEACIRVNFRFMLRHVFEIFLFFIFVGEDAVGL